MIGDDDDTGDGMSIRDPLMPCPTAYPKIKIGMIDVDLRSVLLIEPEGLVSDYQTIHHWITTVAYKVSQMILAISTQKKVIARLEARLYRSYRAASEKKLTEASIKTAIVLDAEYQKAQDKLDIMESQKSTYQIALSAFESKRDLIINMGAELRNRKRVDRSI